MGSLVSVIVANLIIVDVEERALMTVEVKPRFWKRHVDDTCTVLLVDKALNFLDHLNSIELIIRFIVELELNSYSL